MSVSPENDSAAEGAFARLAARKCACAEFHQVQSKKKYEAYHQYILIYLGPIFWVCF